MDQEEIEQVIRQLETRVPRQLMIDGYSDRKLAVMMKRLTISDIWEIRDVLGSAGRPCGNHGAAEERIRTLGEKHSATDLHVIRVEARNEGRSDIICSLVATETWCRKKGQKS